MSDTIYTYYNVNIFNNHKMDNYNIASDRGVICIRIDRPPLGTKGLQQYKVSYAFCSPEDNFSRKVARSISTGRNKVVIESKDPMKVGDVSQKALNLLLESCSGEKSRLEHNGVTVKIPNWLSLNVNKSITPSKKHK